MPYFASNICGLIGRALQGLTDLQSVEISDCTFVSLDRVLLSTLTEVSFFALDSLCFFRSQTFIGIDLKNCRLPRRTQESRLSFKFFTKGELEYRASRALLSAAVKVPFVKASAKDSPFDANWQNQVDKFMATTN